LRSSARVKAAKQKAKDKADDAEPSSSALPPSRSRSKRTAKSQSKDPRRNIVSAQPALTINEPVRDPKGKKRAAPEPNSDDESAGPSTKRARTTSYSLRSSTVKDSSNMPRKSR
ncbi:hypothetical protein GGX14DRAFT_321812, partial [Mycena pura]